MVDETRLAAVYDFALQRGSTTPFIFRLKNQNDEAIKATGIFTLDAIPLDGSTVTIGLRTYTFRTALSSGPTVPDEVLIGSEIGLEIQGSADNLVQATQDADFQGILYSIGTTENLLAKFDGPSFPPFVCRAQLGGVAGNSIATSTTVIGASWSGLTLSGGASLLQNIDFDTVHLTINKRSTRLITKVTGVDADFVVSDILEAEITWTPTPEDSRKIPVGAKATYEVEYRKDGAQVIVLSGTITGVGGINDDV